MQYCSSLKVAVAFGVKQKRIGECMEKREFVKDFARIKRNEGEVAVELKNEDTIYADEYYYTKSGIIFLIKNKELICLTDLDNIVSLW